MNRYHKSDIPGIMVFVIFVFIAVCCIYNYVQVASTCNGVVIKDYMGMPACVESPNILVPVR